MAVRKFGDQWRIDYWDRKGKRHRKLFATKGAAEAEHDRQKTLIRAGEFVATKKTFGAAAEEWLAARMDRRPSTIDSWRFKLDRHLLPELKGVRLDRMSAALIEDFRGRLQQNYSHGTVRNVLGVLGSVLRMSVRRGYIARDPFAMIERHYKPDAEYSDDDIDGAGSDQPVGLEDVLDLAEIRRLIAAATSPLWRMLLELAAGSGMRIGEMTALRWSEVDLDAGVIHVRRSVSWAKGTDANGFSARIYPTKTKAGNRDVTLPRELTLRLKAWKLQCPPNPLNLVFPAPRSGSYIRHSSVHTSCVGAALKAAGLRHVSIHSLRHSYASALIMNGATILEVQRALGHKNAAITLGVYAHYFENQKSDATAKLGAALFAFGHKVDTSAAAGG